MSTAPQLRCHTLPSWLLIGLIDGSSGSKDGKMVAIWDFDDTLVPWYQMKRAYGEQHILDLFDEW